MMLCTKVKRVGISRIGVTNLKGKRREKGKPPLQKKKRSGKEKGRSKAQNKRERERKRKKKLKTNGKTPRE